MKIILLSVIVTYVFLSSLLVFRTIENRSTEMQRELSIQFTEQQHKNAQLFMKWMEEMASLVTTNKVILQSLASREYDNTITPILDGMISSNLYIQDIVMYSNNGSAYTSSNISAILPYYEVKEIAEYDEFLQSDQLSQWQILSAESLVYKNIDPRRKLVYTAKIMDQNEREAGLLFMTVDMKKMASFYHADDPELYGHQPTLILTHDKAILNTDGLEWQPDDRIRSVLESQSQHWQPGGDRIDLRTDEEIILLYRLHNSNDQVAILISGELIKKELRLLRDTLIGVGAVILILFLLFIRQLSRSILDPLKELYKKMRSRHEL